MSNVTNASKVKLQSCHYLLHKLKSSMREGIPINEHSRENDYKYYWSGCQAFKDYVDELNTSKNVIIHVRGNNIYQISTHINDKDNLVTYDFYGNNYKSDANDYLTNPDITQPCLRLF